VAALQGFLQKYSQGPEVDEAKAALEKLQGYRVQLGAFKDEKSAQKALDNLKKRVGNDIPGLEVVAPTGTEKRHIVASGPMTEDDANAACAKLKKAHAHCEVIKR